MSEVFEQERVIHEKYSVDFTADPDRPETISSGKGGEYESQIGFGWTNGVVLSFMHELEQEAE